MNKVNTTKGLKPKDRAIGKTANQWKNTPQQHDFMERWLSPSSLSFGNAFQSAIEAKYSPQYANQIASPAIANKWIQEYTNRLVLSESHIIAALSEIATGKNIDSRSKSDTQVKALEILSKISGLIDTKQTTKVTIVQPILSGLSVEQDKRIVIDNTIKE